MEALTCTPDQTAPGWTLFLPIAHGMWMHHRGQPLLAAMLDWRNPVEEKALGRRLPLVLSSVVSPPRGWFDIRPPAGQVLASASWRHQSALVMAVWEERFAEDLGEEPAMSFDDQRYQSSASLSVAVPEWPATRSKRQWSQGAAEIGSPDRRARG